MPTSVVPSRNSTDPVSVPDAADEVAVSVTVRPDTSALNAVLVTIFATVTVREGEVEPACVVPVGTNVAV